MNRSPSPLTTEGLTRTLALSIAAGSLLASGCASPLYQGPDTELRRSILNSTQRELSDPSQYPQVRELERTPRVQGLGLKPEIMTQLEKSTGIGSYEATPIQLSPTLLGTQQQAVRINLQRAILTATENNLQVQFARLAPAGAEAQREAAEAAFDWVLFANGQYGRTDQPVQQSSQFNPNENKSEQITGNVGVRRRFTGGGQLTIQQGASYLDTQSPLITPTPNPARGTTLSLQVDQPLLRNFGSDTNLAEVRIAANSERDQIQLLKANLLRTVTDVEEAYWDLVGNYVQLQIAQRLLDMGVQVRDVLKQRMDTARDVRTSQFSDAVASVEQRRGDVIRAENQLRLASDRLKTLMNDPNLTVGSEILVLPVDKTVDAPVRFSLVDTLGTAVQNRPEISRALLAIDDASIRQTFSDNQRQAQLDLRTQVQFNGLRGGYDNALADQTSATFVDYLVGVAFEQPIGNRAAEASFRQRRIERMQAVIAYRDAVQRIVNDVKTQLRNVDNNYKLIEQTHAQRLAAAENLRTLEVEEKTIQGLTPEFLDLKLRRQQALAGAEVQELAALTEYNTSIARLYASMGIALERNRIAFRVTDSLEDHVTTENAVSIPTLVGQVTGQPAGGSGEPVSIQPRTDQPVEVPPSLNGELMNEVNPPVTTPTAPPEPVPAPAPAPGQGPGQP